MTATNIPLLYPSLIENIEDARKSAPTAIHIQSFSDVADALAALNIR